MPIKSGDKIVGVIQLINKRDGPFDENDEEIMCSFLIISGPILERSHIYAKTAHAVDEGNEFTGKIAPKPHANDHAAHEEVIAEGDEEEEEDDDEY